MVDKNPYPSPTSDGTASVGNWCDKYLQAVFCTAEPSRGILSPESEELVHTNPVVIRYTGKNLRYIKNQTLRLIQLAIEYRWAAYEDFVLVVQGGTQICYLLIDFIYKKGLKIRYFSGLGGSLIMSTVSDMHKAAAMIPQRLIYKLVKEDLDEVIATGGSSEVSLHLHSMESICAEIYHHDDRTRDQARKLLTVKERDGPCAKQPDYSAYPAYMNLLRCIQGVDRVPTLLVETAMSDSTVKMEVDSLSILLGTKFQVDHVLATDLHIDKARGGLKTLDLVIFDCTIWSLLAILWTELWNGDRHRQAMASFVLERKVHQKICDIKALLRILSWDGNDRTLKALIEDIEGEYRRCKPLQTLRPIRKADFAPTKEDFEDCVRLRNNVSTNNLLQEQRDYRIVAFLCSSVRRTYMGNMETEEFEKDAESFIAKRLYYGRRKVKDIDRKSKAELQIPSTVLTGMPMSENYYTRLSPEDLNSLFSEIARTFKGATYEAQEVVLSVPRKAIRPGRATEVAVMNGYKNLSKLFKGSSQAHEVRLRLVHLTDTFLRQMLVKWGISPKGKRHILLSKFIGQYEMKCLEEFPPAPEPSADYMGRKRRNRSPGSKSPEPQEDASKATRRTRWKKQRSLEFLTSDIGTQGTRHMDEDPAGGSSVTASNAERLASEPRIPSSVSELLQKVPTVKKEPIRELLLKGALQSCMHSVAQDEVALRGLEVLLQENVMVIEAVLSVPGIVHQYLREKGAQ
uniref:ARAD1D12320p n=1 Tax=Blastobotrys adeninivorans TaxID=409370 RepID=A0A060T929_BLAAD